MKPNNTNTGRQTEPTVVISGKTIHDLSPEERALVRGYRCRQTIDPQTHAIRQDVSIYFRGRAIPTLRYRAITKTLEAFGALGFPRCSGGSDGMQTAAHLMSQV